MKTKRSVREAVSEARRQNIDLWTVKIHIPDVKHIATISDLQKDVSGLVREAETEGVVPISRNGRTVVFLISKGKLGGLLETMELQKNDELMALVKSDKAGAVKFTDVPDEL